MSDLSLPFCLDEVRSMILAKDTWCKRFRKDEFRPRRPETEYQRQQVHVRVLRRIERLLEEQIAKGER